MSKNISDLKVAVVHDELVRRGGAERVLEDIIGVFPNADVFALMAGGKKRLDVNGRTYPIRTSFLQRFPAWTRRRPQRLAFLFPQAIEQFDFSEYDVVISSASAFAKGVITRSSVLHVCYCHTPTRYLWDNATEAIDQIGFGGKWLGRSFQHYLRLADSAAAGRPDVFLANSRFTQARIKQYYRRESDVLHPGVDTAFFTPGPLAQRLSGERPFLLVGRLTNSKYFQQATEVCEKLQLPLIVVGVGSGYRHLKRLAGRYTTFAGKLSDEDLRAQYRQARALIQPGVEDFGLSVVEALACGCPVVAYGAGGVQEIVRHGVHGILYTEFGEEALAEAIRQFLEKESDFLPATLQRRALHFSQSNFQDKLRGTIEQHLLSLHT